MLFVSSIDEYILETGGGVPVGSRDANGVDARGSVSLELGGAGGVDAGGIDPGAGAPVELGGARGVDAEGDFSVELGGAGGVDAGGLDAGGVDAGGLDAGGVDAGGLDAGGVDAGGLDAGGVDAGGLDAGGVDAGGLDAGGLDAGRLDTGRVDAGAVDGGGDGSVEPGGAGGSEPGPRLASGVWIMDSYCSVAVVDKGSLNLLNFVAAAAAALTVILTGCAVAVVNRVNVDCGMKALAMGRAEAVQHADPVSQIRAATEGMFLR